MPVVSIDGRQIADGRPGELARRVYGRFLEIRVVDGVKVVYDTQPTSAG